MRRLHHKYVVVQHVNMNRNNYLIHKTYPERLERVALIIKYEKLITIIFSEVHKSALEVSKLI